ncbi:MAG TPA: hypothetical protein DCE28_10905 [Halomonas sp.]|nr:hypothetical protein [Halomonas sp.]
MRKARTLDNQRFHIMRCLAVYAKLPPFLGTAQSLPPLPQNMANESVKFVTPNLLKSIAKNVLLKPYC